jgi:hypothetical protein
MQIADCEALRREIKVVADKLWAARQNSLGQAEPEVYANTMLAYRHLEDASMRLGKAIQALDGGTSVYHKDEVPGA